eukprot:CAMPEP_0115173794 /NCGR_PEP_ID=MMETSP0270-20121206/3507_1 /TAXON_ID=71861 /ORGANISM="Scrippsiella trochoidea, Strain CCMP3099" /LENGTH=57 /DNA_ID=CAMNT_0002586613 /DNA_START=155 /DNA_END=328 /DNA_ORIENTATION=+
MGASNARRDSASAGQVRNESTKSAFSTDLPTTLVASTCMQFRCIGGLHMHAALLRQN